MRRMGVLNAKHFFECLALRVFLGNNFEINGEISFGLLYAMEYGCVIGTTTEHSDGILYHFRLVIKVF